MIKLYSMFDIGAKELVVIAVVLVLLFGAKKIPQLAEGISDAIRTLRRGFSDDVSHKEDSKKRS